MLESGAAVEADTGDAGDCEFNRQQVTLLAGRVVTRCTMDGTNRTAGKCFGVEASSSLGVLSYHRQIVFLAITCPFASSASFAEPDAIRLSSSSAATR